MSAPAVITLESVSKAYALYERPIDAFREALFGGHRHDLFWALRDISFTVREKQRLGIVGPNGAGKSTLLQLITGNLTPTRGHVRVDGRISALLSLVPAWNLEETGIENIRFNLILQGCSPKRVPALTEEIVEFTELGPFIYQPVKSYSSGMSARLSFGIATAINPDILVIDEVLGTGDGYFVAKAHQRMMDFCERGRALLFVSHAIDAVRRMCDSVIWLQHGTIRAAGATDYVLKQYEEDYRRSEDEKTRRSHVERSEARRKTVNLDDLVDESMVRFRLVPRDGANFSDAHFVRSIRIAGLTPEPFAVPLEMVDVTRKEHVATLDVLASEWGRIYERAGAETRVLSRATGRLAGGHFLVKSSASDGRQDVKIEVEVESWSRLSAQVLEVQYVNMQTGAWEPLVETGMRRLNGGWCAFAAKGRLHLPEKSEIGAVRRALAEELKPPVEIKSIQALASGDDTGTFRERIPFAISVHLQVNRIVPIIDVGIKLIRQDGVYAFWQSSGFDIPNLTNVVGELSVVFHFDQNPFGAGTYLVSAYVADGWDIANNYPYAEVYARAVDGLRIEVLREHTILDMGIVNTRARIETRCP